MSDELKNQEAIKHPATAKSEATKNGPRQLPAWLKGHLNSDGLARVAAAIGQAEARTEGEIVPMIVRRSSPLGHVGAFVFLFVALALWAISPLAHKLLLWGVGREVPIGALQLGGLAVAALVAPFARRIDWIARLALGRSDLAENAHRRAQLEFYASRINDTSARAGVLLFASLLERRAVVLADAAIASKLPASAWEDVAGLLLQGLGRGDFSTGFVEAVDRAGARLAEHFPAERHERNELPNELLVFE
jgi:putative membrane protein